MLPKGANRWQSATVWGGFMIRRLIILVSSAMAILAVTVVPNFARAQISVSLEADSTVTVAAVEWHSSGFVRLIYADGSERLVSDNHIRSIRDAEGTDRTKLVLEKRGRVGERPPGYKAGEPSAGGSFLKVALVVGVLGLIVALTYHALSSGN